MGSRSAGGEQLYRKLRRRELLAEPHRSVCVVCVIFAGWLFISAAHTKRGLICAIGPIGPQPRVLAGSARRRRLISAPREGVASRQSDASNPRARYNVMCHHLRGYFLRSGTCQRLIWNARIYGFSLLSFQSRGPAPLIHNFALTRELESFSIDLLMCSAFEGGTKKK